MLYLTSNIAYTSQQCTKEAIDYYTVSQPQARSTCITNQSEMKDTCLATEDIASGKSSQDTWSIKDYTTVDLEAQQNGTESLTNNTGNMNIVQNAAYIVKPLAIPLSSNVALYESNVHQDTGQDEYDYI